MNERISCFSCDRAVDWNEEYVCISRLRKLRSTHGNDEIVEAAASLQICTHCLSKALHGEITFRREVPLLKLEENALHWFAKRLIGSTLPWLARAEEGICDFCESQVMEGDYYTAIEISKEIAKQTGPIEVVPESLVRLATVCESCAKEYMLWWYDNQGHTISVI